MQTETEKQKWDRVEERIRQRRLAIAVRAKKTWKQRLDEALLPVLFIRLLEGMWVLDKIDTSPSVVKALNGAFMLAAQGLRKEAVERLAKRVWLDVRKIVNAASPEKLEQALAAACMMTERLVNEGLLEDGASVPALLGQALIEEWKADGPSTPQLRLAEAEVATMADKMFATVRSLGYFRKIHLLSGPS